MPTEDSTLRKDQAVGWAPAETLLILTIFFLYGASFPPDVNEAHYLGKAKHYWNPEWCRGDLFLESADAHFVFYYAFGWVTKFVSLPAAAWIGRILVWFGMAVAWTWLSRAVTRQVGTAVLSAGLFLLFSRWCSAGGEWLIGGIEAKGFAYVLAFIAVGALVRGYWTAAWLLAGASAAFHVLVGGWLMVAFAWAWLTSGAERPSLVSTIIAGLGACLLAAPSLVAALSLSAGVDAETIHEANRIYVYERLGHHLLIHRFDQVTLAGQVGLAVIWLIFCWRITWSESMNRLQRVVGAALLIATAGTIVDQATLYRQDLAAAILRYYWFRMSDAFLPVGLSLFVVEALRALPKPQQLTQKVLAGLCVLAGLFNLFVIGVERSAQPFPPGISAPRRSVRSVANFTSNAAEDRDESPPNLDLEIASHERLLKLHRPPDVPPLTGVARDWVETCTWIRDNSEPGEKFLTPRAQQSFKWYAERAEVVTWKDVPQDARGLVTWYQTWNEVQPDDNATFDLCGFSDEQLVALGNEYGARFLVIDRTRSRRPLSFPRVYPEVRGPSSWFEVYRLPPATPNRNSISPISE